MTKRELERDRKRGWHVCQSCEETVYCNDKKPCNGLPEGLCDECYLSYHYNHERKSEQ